VEDPVRHRTGNCLLLVLQTSSEVRPCPTSELLSLSARVPAQVGNHIDILSKKWVAQDAGIGAGVDSYFEYLVKGAIMLQDEGLLSMFQGKARTSSCRFLLLSHHIFIVFTMF